MEQRIFLGMHNIPKCHYYRPSTLRECFRVINAHILKLKIIAGGTDIIPALRSGKLILSPDYHFVDISRIAEIKYVKKTNGIIKIGSVTTLWEVERSEIVRRYIPVLVEAIQRIGSLQIRNVATIGGNLCNASPAADSAVPLLILDASVKIGAEKGERMIGLSNFFTGPGKTVLKPDELLLEVQIPVPPENAVCKFYKLGRRNAFTLSVISVGIYMEKNGNEVKDVRIALGAVAPVPMRARNAEEYLIGKKLDESTIEKAASIVKNEVKPLTDVRGSEWYRKEMARNLIKRLLISLL
ncbi:MAG: xanthine dehydrogenase family protein subunit M [Candidatus Jordarchaeaceae archaeon]